MKTILLTLSVFMLTIGSYAQISHGGQPSNWDEANYRDIAFQKFQVGDLSAFKSEDAVTDQYKDIAYRFGVNMDVDLNSNEHGNWTTLENGDRVWRLGMESEGALSLNFFIDQYHIPSGGQIFVYSPDKKQMLGSFTNENASDAQSLAVGLVMGDQVILEYIEPAHLQGQGYLHINRLTHGYRSFMGRVDRAKAGPYGNSGACNINVNCPEGLLYDIQKRSVALIVRNGNAVCSGAMINTTAQDERPYFLTANHCLGSNLDTWVFYFNHETPDCEGNQEAPTNQSVSGANLLASNAESDFALMELNSDVPASYNVCYSGWDATDIESSVISAYGIHHPSGDVKKICFEDDAPYHDNVGTFVNQVWYIDQWELGVTEGGSSGSPLFNQSGHIIGQLAGGTAACQGSVNNGQPDFYGRLGVSWDFGSQDNNSLQSWLDPNGTGQMIIENSCGGSPTENDMLVSEITDFEQVYCDLSTISPSATLVNMGTAEVEQFKIQYTLNGGTAQELEFDGQSIDQFSSISVSLGSIQLTAGSNELKVEILEVNDLEDENEIGNEKIANSNAFEYSEDVTVEILLDNYPDETTWRIEDSEGSILMSGGPYSDFDFSIEETGCFGDGCYTFIIEDSYGDGICCGNSGNGNYQVIGAGGAILGEGGEFGYQDDVDFCIEASAISSAAAFAEINIFPNPSQGDVTVVFGSLASEIEQIRLLDALGRNVYTSNGQSEMGNTQITLQTSSYAPGLYFVSIKTKGNGVITKRLILSE